MKDINATVIVDLKKTEEEIIKNLDKDARWGINKATKEGLVVKEANEDKNWEEFYEIYKNNMLENKVPIFSLKELKEKTKIFFVCKKQEKIIAGAGIWFIDRYDINIPRLFFNASLSEYRKMQPNNLLYWECIKWAKSQGYKEFDLGGWQINARGNLDGVNKFKERWGKVVYYERDYPFFKAIGRKAIRNFKIFSWLNNKLRGN